jgi:hypothetical protein
MKIQWVVAILCVLTLGGVGRLAWWFQSQAAVTARPSNHHEEHVMPATVSVHVYNRLGALLR